MEAASRMQFTFQACADLNNIWESIAMPSDLWGSTNAEHLAAARSFAEKLEQLCHLMTLHPEIGPRRSMLQEGIRSLLFQRLCPLTCEQLNPLGCINGGRLATACCLQRIAALQRLEALRCFAACFVALSHCLPRGSGESILLAWTNALKGWAAS